MFKRPGFGLLMLVVLTLQIAACDKKTPPAQPTPPPPPPPAGKETPPPPPPAPKPTPTPTPPPPRTPTEDEIFAKKTIDDLNREQPLADVFFAYDVAELDDRARGVLQKNFEWMRRWSSTTVLVEGHADSRGTNEYNLALGERRAAAIKDYLVSLGIAANRISFVSKGEESPQCRDEAEACWEKNRRGHFIFTGK
jgi:peptidoglycan-associated lipoprotein